MLEKKDGWKIPRLEKLFDLGGKVLEREDNYYIIFPPPNIEDYVRCLINVGLKMHSGVTLNIMIKLNTCWSFIGGRKGCLYK